MFERCAGRGKPLLRVVRSTETGSKRTPHVWHRRRGRIAQHHPILVEGLKRLEYRGYDSCGVASAYRRRAEAGAASAAWPSWRAGEQTKLRGFTGIAHPLGYPRPPQWLTRTRTSRAGDSPRIALVHNGIIENHDVLRAS